jgi:colicin import membrane protein
MATQPDLLDTTTNGTDLIVVEAERNAVALFTNDRQYDEFYRRVKDSVSDFVPDVTTDKGRREIAKVAFKVTKAKTTLDKAGLALTEEWRRQTNAVNAARKKMTTQLDELAEEVRRPLTEWEAKEAERQERVSSLIQRVRDAAIIREGETADDVERRLRNVTDFEPDEDLFGVRIAEARDTRDATAASLERARDRMRREEADRAELERLRKEAAEREEREREAEAQRLEAERAERMKAEAEERAKREKEESARRIREAEERAAREADERARAEERRQAEEKLAEERRAREAAEREAADRRRAEEERAAWEDKERREREAREADERHRKDVLAEVAEDMTAVLLFHADADAKGAANAVANAIAGGIIRHVRVTF